ncbi:MAG: tyrosine--tRNA ligase [Candidatus Vogelbacteria bacterium]|jgi:tyrosyl-tRNA synthetase|nr:tyrosine--tRNA ligase [Candidatus Vogelbacteria bacterium]
MSEQETLIAEILTRSVDNIVDRAHLEARLKAGEKLRVKLGIDPTSPNLHIGRAIPLLKLRKFQDLGHQIIFLIGDFTAVIGDTSDKDAERPMLSREIVTENMQAYLRQAEKILNINLVEVVYNSHWLGGLLYNEIGEQADVFSLNDFIARSNIKARLDKGTRVSLREVLYPIMQGYDSVAVRADVELGGADQWFNLLAGRKLQKHYDQEPQDILTTVLIEGLDGRKMSSSWGNTINLLDEPKDMFGKVMSLRDDLIGKYFEHCTTLPVAEVKKYQQQLEQGEINPRDLKEILALEITKLYHGEEGAKEGQQYFQTVFRDKGLPEEIPEVKVTSANILDVLVETGLVESKSEARRVIDQGGVRMNDEVVKSVDVEVTPEAIIQKGKRQVVKVLL